MHRVKGRVSTAKRRMTQDKTREASSLLKKAERLTHPSILSFRIKPDWEAAAPVFEKAAKLYKVDSCSGIALS